MKKVGILLMVALFSLTFAACDHDSDDNDSDDRYIGLVTISQAIQQVDGVNLQLQGTLTMLNGFTGTLRDDTGTITLVIDDDHPWSWYGVAVNDKITVYGEIDTDYGLVVDVERVIKQ
jgi:uncharacterized protein YdeI (BOF family)